MATLPPKLYFRIGEVASLVGVEPHVLRYWEREFRSIRPTKSAKGQRVYSRRDVENLMRVRDLLYADGFTIAGAKKKLQRGPGEAEGEAESRARNEAPPVAAAERLAPPPPVESDSGLRFAAASSMVTPRPTERDEATEPKAAPAKTKAQLRTTLLELRTEIEAFLTELGG